MLEKTNRDVIMAIIEGRRPSADLSTPVREIDNPRTKKSKKFTPRYLKNSILVVLPLKSNELFHADRYASKKDFNFLFLDMIVVIS